jgi:ABC-2 type transport system ATP-binding protein
VSVPVATGTASLVEALRLLDGAQIAVSDVALRRPTLDDVFLSLTGHAAEAADDDPTTSDETVAAR